MTQYSDCAKLASSCSAVQVGGSAPHRLQLVPSRQHPGRLELVVRADQAGQLVDEVGYLFPATWCRIIF